MFAPVVSVASLPGKPASEDRAVTAVLELEPVGRIHLYAVIDGHGGTACAAFVHEHLEAYFAAAFAAAFGESGGRRTQDSLLCGTLRETYRTLDVAFRREHASAVATGACVLTVCLCNDRIYTACVGDCRALIVTTAGGAADAGGGVSVESLTVDQTCRNDTECDRVRRRSRDPEPIRPAPNSVRKLPRVAGSLAVTRAIGDAYLKETHGPRFRSLAPYVPYITARPVCTARRFRSGSDRYLILGSDGLFDWSSNAEVADRVHAFLSRPGGEWSDAADHLVEWTLTEKVCPSVRMDRAAVIARSAATSGGHVHDDITAMVISLGVGGGDGYSGATAAESRDAAEGADEPPSKRRCIDVDAEKDETETETEAEETETEEEEEEETTETRAAERETDETEEREEATEGATE